MYKLNDERDMPRLHTSLACLYMSRRVFCLTVNQSDIIAHYMLCQLSLFTSLGFIFQFMYLYLNS